MRTRHPIATWALTVASVAAIVAGWLPWFACPEWLATLDDLTGSYVLDLSTKPSYTPWEALSLGLDLDRAFGGGGFALWGGCILVIWIVAVIFLGLGAVAFWQGDGRARALTLAGAVALALASALCIIFARESGPLLAAGVQRLTEASDGAGAAGLSASGFVSYVGGTEATATGFSLAAAPYGELALAAVLVALALAAGPRDHADADASHTGHVVADAEGHVVADAPSSSDA